MSSSADTLKKPSEADEPSAKKAKLDSSDGAKSDDKHVSETVATNDNNNGTPTKLAEVDNSNGNSESATGSGSAKIPIKVAANGGEQDGSVDEDSEADQEAFGDPKIASRLEEVEDIQTSISRLNEQASEEILKVEQKFNKLRRPHFEKRNALLKDVPNFWLTTLANHPMIAPMIESAEDEDCLHYMINLDVEELDDIKSGYNLKFYFAQNPYINNDLIVRELRHLNSEEVVTDTTPIEYKDTEQGRNLREIVESSLAQMTRKVRPTEMQNSFFAWLSHSGESGADEVAEIIKDQIWPSPLEFFFTNPDDYGEGSDEDDDSEDDDEEDYDDEEGIENDIEAGGMPEDEVLDEDLEGEELDDEEDDLDDEEGEDAENEE